MLRPLSVIRRRVDRLATQAASAGCLGDHQRYRTPPWPEADAGGRCVCGTALEYVQIVNELHPGPESASAH